MEGIDHRHHDLPSHDEAPLPRFTPADSKELLSEFTPADSEELRFTLKEMFLATTLAAVILALFRSLGIYGAVLSFLSAIIATLIVVPRCLPEDRPRHRLYFDFVWGIVMPVVCLVFDPFVFKNGDFADYDPFMFPPQQPFSIENLTQIHINPAAYYAWPILAGQIATLGLVLAWGKSLRPIAPIIAGVLATGFMISLCLSLFLVFPAALGTLLFGIGLLGFTPIFTCLAYFRRMRLLWFISKGDRAHEWRLALAMLGILVCIGLAWAVGTVALNAVPPETTVNW